MRFDLNPREVRHARVPHELFLFNLVFCHLLLGAGTLVLMMTQSDYFGALGNMPYLISLGFSLTLIAVIHARARRARSWFAVAHWRLAMRRSWLLLLAYALTGLIIGAGVLMASGIEKKSMQEIVLTVATRIAIVPILLAVMVTFVLESSALYQAEQGEVPDGALTRFPPPEGIREARAAGAADPRDSSQDLGKR